jgi:hypothetical protein
MKKPSQDLLIEIEVNRYSAAPEAERNLSCPRIDWSWDRADKILRGKALMGVNAQVLPRGSDPFYRWSWGLPQVFLPHLVTFLVATALFISGIRHHLIGFSLGCHGK